MLDGVQPLAPDQGPRHRRGPIRNMIMALTQNQTGLPLSSIQQRSHLAGAANVGRDEGHLCTPGNKATLD